MRKRWGEIKVKIEFEKRESGFGGLEKDIGESENYEESARGLWWKW